MKLASLTSQSVTSLVREGRKILLADPTGRAEPIVDATTADKLVGMSKSELLRLLKQVRAAATGHYKARQAKDWLQRTADALKAR